MNDLNGNTREHDDGPPTGKILIEIDDLVHSLPLDPHVMGKDPVFTAHRPEYVRACTDDRLEGATLARVRGYWNLISALAVHGSAMQKDFDDSLAAFRDTYPQARNAALVLARVWDQAMASQTIKAVHKDLVAKGRVVVPDLDDDMHHLAS